ncbi:MAG: DUF4494 domain-containing protein [Flavobacteriales bacterium]
MSNWFICKISYLKQAENGSIYKKSESYVLNSMSFTEAEARLQAALEEVIPEYNLLTCVKTNISDIVFDESAESYFKAKITYKSVDADSGKERAVTENYLIAAESLKDACMKIEERMEGSVVDWELPAITKTTVTEVFPYTEDGTLEDVKTASKKSKKKKALKRAEEFEE